MRKDQASAPYLQRSDFVVQKTGFKSDPTKAEGKKLALGRGSKKSVVEALKCRECEE